MISGFCQGWLWFEGGSMRPLVYPLQDFEIIRPFEYPKNIKPDCYLWSIKPQHYFMFYKKEAQTKVVD